MANIGDIRKAKPFTLKSGNKPEFKMMGSSPFKKAGCAPGDPGCGGDFKVKKKSKIGRAIKKAASWVGSEVKDIKSNIRRKKINRKKKKNTVNYKGMYPKTLSTNPNFVVGGEGNKKGQKVKQKSKEVLAKIAAHEY